jgi:hypothetical protein
MSQRNGTTPNTTTAEAVKNLPEPEKCDVVTTAIEDLSDVATAGVVTEAIKTLPPDATANVMESAMRTLPTGAQGDLIDRFAPDQSMTNDIWRWIVRTFSLVLLGAMIALVTAVLVSFWRPVDAAVMQMLLTIFTTTAGILAGFVSGRASMSGRARF